MSHYLETREFLRPGDPVPMSGSYVVVDEFGADQDMEPFLLEEGDTFPELRGRDLYYRILSIDDE